MSWEHKKLAEKQVYFCNFTHDQSYWISLIKFTNQLLPYHYFKLNSFIVNFITVNIVVAISQLFLV